MTTEESSFTSEEIANQSKGNANAFALGAIAILKQQGQSTESFFRQLGELAAPGWEAVKGKGAMAAARPMALSLVSFGATLESISGNEGEAQVVISGWPAPELLEFFHLDRSDIDPSWSLVEPIGDYLGLDIGVESQNDRVTLTLTRR